MKIQEIRINTSMDGQKRFYYFMSAIMLKEGISDIEIKGDSLTVGNYLFRVINTNKDSEEIFVGSEGDLLKIKQLFSFTEKEEDWQIHVIPYEDILEGKKGCVVWYEDEIKKQESNIQFVFQKYGRIQNVKNSTDTAELLECINDKSWHNLCDNPKTRQFGFVNREKSEIRMFGLMFMKSIEDEGLRNLFMELHDRLMKEQMENVWK
ncbi:MAG: hypothetical protein M0P12_00480 [Paludibacteraceae bacterium]|nr:hypothetical protein [Paludibacteraceae bacterium]MCK9615954.1 hypothetical protein [Candidatus Omnitrophota bacterium]